MRTALAALTVFCSAILGLDGEGFRYREALPGYVYRFPADHFAHPDFRTEWWYYTGNVLDEKGKKFGFELVFFRVANHREEHREKNANHSVWRADDVYLAHAAVTDIDGKHFYYSERTNRAGPGIAGASASKAEVWNGNWSATWTGEKQALFAVADDFRFELNLQPLKPLVIHGVNGVSQKGDLEGQASHYVSYTRLGVTGHLRLGEEDRIVHGSAWMDQEWFTEDLDPTLRGWDWFSVQLEDKSDLMLYDFRKKDGSIGSHSSGTYIDPTGKARHLLASDFRLTPLSYWGKYPIRWRIEVPELHLTLECQAALPNQELKTQGTNYWEGAVSYSGSGKGSGYLEMTGYDKPVTFR